ncbi:MAG: chemotaxis protein CheW [Candidatus Omnitrophica bacterium]|nr:chemotaxis protein CheW [Candidatus Omnitrophota bacterium]
MSQENETATKSDRQILVFNLMDEEMGLPVERVREVLRPQTIHPLVHTPDFIEGVIYVRKYVLVVIALRKKFGLKPNADCSAERIIIGKANHSIIGLLVDRVSEVLSVPARDIQPTPEILAQRNQGRFVSGLAKAGDRVITLLDLDRLVTTEELAHLSGIKA